MTRSSTPRITASVTIALITPATPNDMLVVDEDPVTGSAHSALGPYWGERLGKSEFTAFQASARGGVVRVRLQGDRVILSGQAVTVMTGELLA